MIEVFLNNFFQGSPNCVCSFIVLEIIYVLGNIIWELYFIITYYSDEGRFYSYYDDANENYDYNIYGSGSHDYDVSYYGMQNKHKQYTNDDFFWLAPLIFFRKDIVM